MPRQGRREGRGKFQWLRINKQKDLESENDTSVDDKENDRLLEERDVSRLKAKRTIRLERILKRGIWWKRGHVDTESNQHLGERSYFDGEIECYFKMMLSGCGAGHEIVFCLGIQLSKLDL